MFKMKNIRLGCFFVCAFASLFPYSLGPGEFEENTSIVYCDTPRGRLGDCLIAYIRAKWFSHLHNLPICYRPFSYSEDFMIHELEPHISSPSQLKHLQKTRVVDLKSSARKKNVLFSINYRKFVKPFFDEIKKDPVYMKKLRAAIHPRGPIDLIYPPNDGSISVAVHVRKGGGYDKPIDSVQIFSPNPGKKSNRRRSGSFADITWPLKFPPEQFYINQLKKLSKMLNHTKIYAYIFTDDKNPQALTSKIEKNVNLPNITYDYRVEENRHDKNVLCDFFSMMNFDCMIRADSQFSQIAHLLGEFKIVIFPSSYHWEKNSKDQKFLIMDKVIVEKNSDL